MEPQTQNLAKEARATSSAKMCVQELFVAEKRLFEQIFDGSASAGSSSSLTSTPTRYISFVESVISPTVQLLNFPIEVSRSRRFPKKLFSIMDLYRALSNLLPEMEQIFKPVGWELIATDADRSLSRLADAAMFTLLEFEKTLLWELSTVVNPGGGIHTVARYVMKYLKSMLAFKQDLSKISIPEPALSLESVISEDLIKDYFEIGGKSGLALHFNWIATVLQYKLEQKSKLYEDPSLAHLFMKNNIFYMCSNIRDSGELKEMIGDDYFKNLRGKFRQAAMNYRRSTWLKVLNCLTTEGVYVSSPIFSSGLVVSKSVLRKKLKSFIAMFEEVCKTQTTWLVPDIHLREELRIDISQKLIMAYCYFCNRFQRFIESEKQPKKYAKYSAEELESAILNLFESRTTFTGMPSRDDNGNGI